MLNLPAITQWLNGQHAGTTMLALRIAFFAAFVLAALWLAWGRRGAGGRSGKAFHLLGIGTVAALLGVLCYQATWQLLGARRVDFMRFMRNHNPRPSTLIERASILDCQGEVLAAADPLPGYPWRRRYPLGEAAAHVVGYFDPRFGLAGMERAADLALSGYGGTTMDELGRLGRNLMSSNRVEGHDVHLTLDARLQRKAYELMKGRRGAVVVMRPADGAVKVLLSMPAFDPLRPGDSQADSEGAPLLNRALQGLYPPGSTFKVLMAALAAEQRISPRFDCPGEGFRAARDARPIRDSEYYLRAREGLTWHGHGRIGLRDGFVHSSNVYFAQLGLACNPEGFNDLMKRVQITARFVLYRSDSGQLASVAGAVPVVAAADRRTRSQLAIGQGKMVVTPLHVTLWSATIAGGGRLHWPHLDARATPRAPLRVLSAAAAANTRALMREAVQHGTGRGADLPGLDVCGHSWFTCFAPASRPALVVTVLVERGGYGSRAALPMARALLEEAARLGMLRRGAARGGTEGR